MTETLAEKTCTPCRGGIPPLTREEAERFRAQASDWELRDDAHRIERTFRFRSLREAGAFVQKWTRHNTGNFTKIGPLREKLPARTQQNQSVARQFPAK
jgi:Pterin 4 alpha carbinolamine dehydratase